MARNEPGQESLEHLAAALAGGREVDWETAEIEAGSDDERRWLRNLRVVAEVARTARQEHGEAEATVELGVESAAPLRPGDTPTLRSWGHLNLLERIGIGGYGEVHRAWDTRLNRPVALKLLHADGADEETLLAEAQLLARVEHPNLARVYGVEKHEARIGIWMELIEGVDLQSLVKESGPLPPAVALRAARDVAAALQALHDNGVLHRDVKPQNIVQAADGRFVLMDLGAGRKRRLEDGDSGLVVSGTPRFLAPEILLERAPANPRSEVYALGVTLYHLLSATFPVDGTLAELHQRHREDAPRSLALAAPQLSAAMVALVDRAVAADPARRFASAGEFGQAIDGQLEADGPRASPLRGRPAWLALAAIVVVGAGLWMARPGGRGIPLTAEVQLGELTDSGWAPLPPGAVIDSEDQVQITIQLSRSAHVYLLNRDALGNTVVLFPMRGSEMKNPLPAGRPVTIPGIVGGERMGWAFSKLAGAEDFLVIASREPLKEFEGELLQLAAVDVGGGLSVQDLGGGRAELALLEDFVARGVVGMVPAKNAAERTDVFALAEDFAVEAAQPLWMHRLRLENSGR